MDSAQDTDQPTQGEHREDRCLRIPRGETVTHPFDLYFRRHGRWPQCRVDSGACRITVTFAPGYITITQSHPYASEIYITRSAWVELLRKVIPLTRKWKGH